MTLGLLQMAALHPCAYKDDTPCPEEWRDEPWKWCGACLAREWLARAERGEMVEITLAGPEVDE